MPRRNLLSLHLVSAVVVAKSSLDEQRLVNCLQAVRACEQPLRPPLRLLLNFAVVVAEQRQALGAAPAVPGNGELSTQKVADILNNFNPLA